MDRPGPLPPAPLRLHRHRASAVRGGGTTADYLVLLTETALHWTGTHTPPDAPRQAWARLHDAARHPHVTIQIVPAAAPRPAQPLCAFTLIDRPPPHHRLTAVMDTPVAAVTFTGRHDLAIFEALWTHLHVTALDPDTSTAWLSRLLGMSTAATTTGTSITETEHA